MRLPIVDCRLLIADCRLPIANCRLPIADCRLPGIWYDTLEIPGYHRRGLRRGHPPGPVVFPAENNRRKTAASQQARAMTQSQIIPGTDGSAVDCLPTGKEET